jgi:plasmid stabilization system protein ParE
VTIRWTEAAIRDLEELHAFISADRAAAADRTVDSVLNAVETRSERSRDSSTLSGIRAAGHAGERDKGARSRPMVDRISCRQRCY